MDRSEQDIAKIILKYIEKEQLSAEESATLKNYLTGSMANRRKFVELTKKQGLKKKLSDFSGITKENAEATWQKIQEKLREDIQLEEQTPFIPTPQRSFTWIRYAAAAIIIITAGAMVYLLAGKSPDTHSIKPIAQTPAQDILPGGDRAILTLGDGSTIVLDSARNGQLSRQGAVTINKADGRLTYSKGQDGGDAVVYNTLRTPRAGQYQVVLPDGSQVWLNNASSLRYPAVFSGTERLVELTGEAYFEIAKDKQHPFKVHIDGGNTVEVLGTHFNINAYPDEAIQKTTLLEGTIRFSTPDKQAVLRPGQQADADAGKQVKILEDVDTEGVIAWKKGYFHFSHARTEDAMRQLSRWYDVEVSYENGVPHREFHGKIQRSLLLSQVLEILNTNQLHCYVQGRKLIVKE